MTHSLIHSLIHLLQPTFIQLRTLLHTRRGQGSLVHFLSASSFPFQPVNLPKKKSRAIKVTVLYRLSISHEQDDEGLFGDCWSGLCNSPHAELLIYPSSCCFLMLYLRLCWGSRLMFKKSLFRIGRFCTKLFFLLAFGKKTFQFKNFTKLRAFHNKPYDTLMLGGFH